MLANQVSSLILEETIETTIPKAKATRRLAEKMVTLGKKGELHHRRQAISRIRNKNAVAKLFSDIAPRYTNRAGGYTRIIRLGQRRGDAAEVCLLEWVSDTDTTPAADDDQAEAAAKHAAAEGDAEEAKADDVEEAEADDAEEAKADDAEEAKADDADKKAPSDG